MRFGILGPLEVVDDHGREVALSARKERALLAILLLHANEVVSADRLVEGLWSGERPASALKGLHVHVSRLRRRLAAATAPGDERLFTEASGYLLQVAAGELDSERFAGLLRRASDVIAAGDCGSAVEMLGDALALWRGPAFSDFEYEEFAQAEIARLSELRVVAVEQRITAELELGRAELLIGELERLVREHPYRERLRGQLMLALYRAGRQADALTAYRSARSVLVEELGIEPSAELRQLHEAILAQNVSLLRVAANLGENGSTRVVGHAADRNVHAPFTNLPPQIRGLVGRDNEQRRLRDLLDDGERGSIVTVTGIGGVGKTRLVIAVAADLVAQSPGGVFLVRLAGIHDPGSILPMIADAIGVAGQGEESLESVLVRRLGELPTIVILDNFEQLLAGAAIVAALAASAEHLRVLLTSQVPLRIGAEQLFPLDPLDRQDAAALFIERARGRIGEFAPTRDDRQVIDEICGRVDYMPLAIELAAARLGVLGPSELARRLERPLSVLTRGDRDAPERQRSLRAAIDWTYALLTPEQQSLFARLGVCAGAVPLEFVEALSLHGTAPETLDALDELLACSLVRRQEHERFGIRFLVPQALRDYALERLIETGEEPEVRALHARQVLKLGRAARLWKWGASAEDRSALLAAGDEIRPALAWSRQSDSRLHVRICSALCSYWTYAGVLSEIRGELGHARASGVGSPADRAWVTTALAKIAQMFGNAAEVQELLAAAIAEWQAVGDEYERALGLGPLTWVVRWDGAHEHAVALARESLEILRRSGERRLVLRGLVFLAHALTDSQDYQGAKDVLAEADQLAAGDPAWELAPIHGDCAEMIGDYLGALALFAQSLSWSATTGETHQILMDMRAIVLNLAWSQHHESALEAYELTQLEERRTGRSSTAAVWVGWLAEAIAAARSNTSADAAAAACARAASVDVAQRARRVIELAEAAVASSHARRV